MTAGKTATTFFYYLPGCDSDARMARCCSSKTFIEVHRQFKHVGHELT